MGAPAVINMDSDWSQRVAQEIGDREAAIRAGIEMLKAGDVLLVAGKGHETGQILADRVIPFDETEIVTRILKELGGKA